MSKCKLFCRLMNYLKFVNITNDTNFNAEHGST